MQLDLSKSYFYEVSGIVGIKAHIEKISKLEIDNSKVSGQIELNLSYSDNEGMECFKVINFPFEIILDELKVIDVNLSNVSITLVEGEGVDISYSLVVNYLVEEQKMDVEIDIIDDVNEPTSNCDIEENLEAEELNKIENESIEKIKCDISKDYEEKLLDKLNERNDNVIVTKTHSSVDDFLSFFDEKYSKKYSIKSLYVEKEEDLNKIAKEYQVSLETLLAGYDKANHKVMFKIDK